MNELWKQDTQEEHTTNSWQQFPPERAQSQGDKGILKGKFLHSCLFFKKVDLTQIDKIF